MVTRKTTQPGHGDICEQNKKDIGKLSKSLYGDGNGNPGLIRRVDKIELQQAMVIRQNWAIIGMLVGIVTKLIVDIF